MLFDSLSLQKFAAIARISRTAAFCDANIVTELAVAFPQLCEDFSVLESLDLSEMELWLGGVPSDDLTALIAEIATDLGITVAQATPIVKYNPTYNDILPVDVFDFLSLERSWINA